MFSTWLRATSVDSPLILHLALLQVLLHVLFEHASGYALFAVKEVEEIGMLLPQVGPRFHLASEPTSYSRFRFGGD